MVIDAAPHKLADTKKRKLEKGRNSRVSPSEEAREKWKRLFLFKFSFFRKAQKNTLL